MRMPVVVLILSMSLPMVAGAEDQVSLEQQRKAAEHGSSDDQVDMGILYEFGFNMPKNDVNALAWYMRAADQGSVLGAKRRDLLKTHMTAEQVDAARNLSAALGTDSPAKVEESPSMDKQGPPDVPTSAENPPSESKPSLP